MPRNLLTLGLILLSSTAALAQNGTYTVKSGDTISAIAARLHVSQRTLIAANGLTDQHRLKLGQKLRVPSGGASTGSHSTSGGYVVRDGEVDWTIAKKHGLTVAQLHRLNAGVRWNALQVGQHLNVGGASSSAPTTKTVAKADGSYVVRTGDNDWTIASRLGVSAKTLRALNPSVKWDRLQIGTRLSVPGSSKSVASTSIKSRTVAVKGEDVVLRAKATSDSTRLATVDHGVRAKVLDKDGNWYRLKFNSGRTGWMREDFLRPATGSELAIREGFPNAGHVAAAKPAPKVTAKPVKKTVVAKAAPKAKPVPVKPKRTLVASVAKRPSAFSSRIVASQRVAGSVTSRAQSWRGVRYRYGAMSRNATDCSGFTSQVFKSVGVKLPRTSGEQASVGRKVAKGDLKAGDLVFFHTVRGKRISHVGIYMGGGKFIHASSGGGKVMVSSLNEGYYSNRFVTARRISGAKIQGEKAVKAAQSSQQASLPDILPDSVEDTEVTR